MTRRLALLLIGIGYFALPATATAAKPNIIFILADDLGHGDLACYGAPDIRTPALDGLARQGVRFTQYYANAPECTPTRTALMTGRYPQRVGGLECAMGIGNVGRYDDAERLAKQHDLGLPVADSVLAKSLKAAGYRTNIVGKWHLGYEPKLLPLRHGFDHFFGILGGNSDYFTHTEASPLPIFYEDDRPIQRPGYLTHLLTDEAVRVIQKADKQPFFLYLAYTVPHAPYQGPGDGSLKLSEKEFNKGTRTKYIEMVEDMDRQIGKVLQALEMQGLAEQTLVVFASDNGGTGPGRNAPYSGKKSGLLEGGIRVPCIARWPGHLKARSESRQACLTMDLTASLLHAGSAELPRDRPLDGIDILQHVAEGKPDVARRLFWRERRGEVTWKAARDGALKYVHHVDGKKTEEWLFDIDRDPTEQHDLRTQRPEETRRMKELLAAWEKEVQPSR